MTTLTHHDAVELLTHIAAGPMAERLSNQAERVALLTLDTAAYNDERVTMSELGRRIGMSRAAITALTDRMERQGLMQRLPSPTDRRATFIEITKPGRALVLEALQYEVRVPA